MDRAAKTKALKAEMLHRLRTIGALAWETPRLSNGAPTIHCVWDGQYYGFYPLSNPKSRGLKVFEREFMKRLNDHGAVCAAVGSVALMEEAMDLDISKRELRRLLPTSQLVKMLEDWGDGKPVPQELEIEILALPDAQKSAVYSIYFDKMKINQIAEESGLSCKGVSSRRFLAIQTLRERLIKKHDIVGDHVLR